MCYNISSWKYIVGFLVEGLRESSLIGLLFPMRVLSSAATLTKLLMFETYKRSGYAIIFFTIVSQTLIAWLHLDSDSELGDAHKSHRTLNRVYDVDYVFHDPNCPTYSCIVVFFVFFMATSHECPNTWPQIYSRETLQIKNSE